MGRTLMSDTHYRVFSRRDLRGVRNEPGVIIGTARVNPGRQIACDADLDDAEKSRALRSVYEGLRYLKLDALISIGGDGTLMTANYLHQYAARIDDGYHCRIIHLPKTIDNDYDGIDFAFGFFSAVDNIAKQLLNLRADAHATSSYFIVQTMGRQAAWLAYGAATAGEADLVVGVEDAYSYADPDGILSLDLLAEAIVNMILERQKDGNHFGVVVLAEGLSDYLPAAILKGAPRDTHGNLRYGQVPIAQYVAVAVGDVYKKKTGQQRAFKTAQFGYESRSCPPHAFDVLLGSQLGIGAYRALVEEELDAHMVSVHGQLSLRYVPFAQLIDGETLTTRVRYVPEDSDYARLARYLESRTARGRVWGPGPK